ncbi:MAG: hypothetical protein E6Q40_10200 [Cupriavidus sp.]|nr:MAG: hypothetical protein E6Q40_10200 [Cupriavidus sp.]
MKTKTMRATVQFSIPEFELVRLLADDGETTLSVGKLTEGIDWRTLREGQVLICELDLWEHATRVVRATLAAPDEVAGP